MTMITREIQWWPAGETAPRTIRASVSLPEPHPSLGYQCTLTVEGFAERHSTAFHDVEGMPALTYTLNMVPHVLEHLVRASGGGRIAPRLGRMDDLDLLESERELEYLPPGASAPVPIQVAISPPYQEGEMWCCELTIRGFSEDHRTTVRHVDTIGALTEALCLAPRRPAPPGRARRAALVPRQRRPGVSRAMRRPCLISGSIEKRGPR
jgi:hypothetical protein